MSAFHVYIMRAHYRWTVAEALEIVEPPSPTVHDRKRDALARLAERVAA